MSRDPQSVLFVCTMNAVRSPMAAAILKHLAGRRLYVHSVGVREGSLDGFAVAVMGELGIDITDHRPSTLEDLEEKTSFDLVVTLSPEAHHQALELTRTAAIEVEYWATQDPTVVDGTREARLDAYRAVRDRLFQQIKARFRAGGSPVV